MTKLELIVGTLKKHPITDETARAELVDSLDARTVLGVMV